MLPNYLNQLDCFDSQLNRTNQQTNINTKPLNKPPENQDSRNRRRHAWDFPTVKTDGFKLGNLLERKRGFEKLDQEASDRSDDEPNSSSNALLSNAQFT